MLFSACAWAQSDEIADIFRPYETDQAALSPDGKYLAFTQRTKNQVHVLIRTLETNAVKRIELAEDEVDPFAEGRERIPSRVTFLRWATPDRLIISLDDALIWGIDADGKNAEIIVRGRDIQFMAETSSVAVARSMRPRRQGSAGQDAAALGEGGASGDAAGGSEAEPAALGADGMPIGGDESVDDAGDDDMFGRGRETDDMFDTGGRVASTGRGRYRPFIVGMSPDDPEHIHVEARGAVGPMEDGQQPNGSDVGTLYFKASIRKSKFSAEDDYLGASRVLVDKQGKPRLLVSHFGSNRKFAHIPQSFSLQRPLDDYLGNADLAFHYNPQTLLGRRSFPLGFDFDPNILYYASNLPNDRYGIYALNLQTKTKTPVAIEHPTFDLAERDRPFVDDMLVFDRKLRRLVGVRFTGMRRQTIWIDPELRHLQSQLAKKFPESTVEVLDWDNERTSFLLSISGPSDPGGFHVFSRKAGKLVEHAKRAPWLSKEKAYASGAFELKAKDGRTLFGYLTMPRATRLKKTIPVIVYCHDGPWNRDLPGYNRGAQALASMGFAVVQVNFRGSAGFGHAHLNALRRGYDRVALEDVLETLDQLNAKYPFSKRLVALLGNGYGGYLALRGLQLHPERFRCAVAINAPTDLAVWVNQPSDDFAFWRDVRRDFLGSDVRKLRELSPISKPELFTKPVLFVESEQDDVVPVTHSSSLRSRLDSLGQSPRVMALRNEGHGQWLPGTNARVFKQLEDFFNETIYNFEVKTGEAEVVEDPVKPKANPAPPPK